MSLAHSAEAYIGSIKVASSLDCTKLALGAPFCTECMVDDVLKLKAIQVYTDTTVYSFAHINKNSLVCAYLFTRLLLFSDFNPCSAFIQGAQQVPQALLCPLSDGPGVQVELEAALHAGPDGLQAAAGQRGGGLRPQLWRRADEEADQQRGVHLHDRGPAILLVPRQLLDRDLPPGRAGPLRPRAALGRSLLSDALQRPWN